MSPSWTAVRWDDVAKDEPVRRDQGHAFVSPKRISWLRFCRYCGHIPGKNYISLLVTKIGCAFAADPRYRAWRAGGRRAT